MFPLSQIGFVYVKLGFRNLRFWTSAKHMTLIRKTPGGGGVLIRRRSRFIRVKRLLDLHTWSPKVAF